MTPTWRRRTLVGAAFVAAVGLRLWLTRGFQGPVIFADETAYLFEARLLAGHEPLPTMGDDPFYHPAYAVLLAPLAALVDDPATLYRGALVVNAVLSATVLPLTYLLCRQVLGQRPGRALGIATVSSVLPPVVLHAGLVWSENLVGPAVLVVALCAHRAFRSGTPPAATALAAAAVVAYATHGRLLAVVAVVAVVLAAAGRAGLVSRRATAAGWATLVVGVAAVRLANRWFVGRLWSETPTSSERAIVERLLDEPSRFGSAALSLAGQSWYLVASTAGLAALGVLYLVQRARHHPRAADRWTNGFLAAATAALLTGAALFLINPDRVDQQVYGRYGEAVVALLVAAGLARLGERARRSTDLAVVSSLMVVLAAVVVTGRGGSAFSGARNPFNVLGLEWLAGPVGRLDVATATAAGCVGVGMLVLLSRPRWWAAPAVAIPLFLALTAVAHQESVRPVHHALDGMLELPAAVPAIDAVTPIDRIAYDRTDRKRISLFGYQYQLPEVAFRLWHPARGPAPSPLVVTRLDWPDAERRGARLLFPEPAVEQGLWVLPGRSQEALEDAGFLLPRSGDGSLPLSARRARVRLPSATPTRFRPSETRAVTVRLVHAGAGAPWPAFHDRPGRDGEGAVRVLAVWRRLDGTVATQQLADLPRRIFPGEDVEIELSVVAATADGRPLASGRYRLGVEAFQQGVGPFGPESETVVVDVTVTPTGPGARAPGG